MKPSVRATLICLLLGSVIFAKSEQPPGEPPFGLAVRGDAAGTKLNGVLTAEFYLCVESEPGVLSCRARIILRLRKGGTDELEMFYGETTGINPGDTAAAQAAIVALMEPLVIDRFFGNNNGVFTDDPSLLTQLKSATEFSEADFITTTTCTLIRPSCTLTLGTSKFVVTDLVIAVS